MQAVTRTSVVGASATSNLSLTNCQIVCSSAAVGKDSASQALRYAGARQPDLFLAASAWPSGMRLAV